MELIIKKCLKCGAMVEAIKDCICDNCGIKCCGEQMKTLVANSENASFEKHVPVVHVKFDIVDVDVPHVMEDDHYIEWVALVTDNEIRKHFFKPNEQAKVTFDYVEGSKVYAYCNKHGLWMADVKSNLN